MINICFTDNVKVGWGMYYRDVMWSCTVLYCIYYTVPPPQIHLSLDRSVCLSLHKAEALVNRKKIDRSCDHTSVGQTTSIISVGQWASIISVGQWANIISVGQWANIISVGQWANIISVGQRANIISVGQRANIISVGQRANIISVGQKANCQAILTTDSPASFSLHLLNVKVQII